MLDTHCHIDLYPQPEEVLIEIEKAGITVVSMTNLPSHFERGFSHFLPFKKIRMALGMHPLYADQHNMEFPIFLKNLCNTSYIGEVGLDFSREGLSTKEIQITTFKKILIAIRNQKKILSIHSRKAESEVLSLLIENNVENAIFHWYSGPLYLIDMIIEAGYFFSINPAMIKSKTGRKIIEKIPVKFILTETDGPFIKIGNLVIKPGEVRTVVLYLSEIWGISEEETNVILRSNFRALVQRVSV